VSAPVSSAGILQVAVWFGLVAGIGEGWYMAVRTTVLRLGMPGFSSANLVTALESPLMYALAFLTIGIVLAVAFRRRAWTLHAATIVFATLTLASWINSTRRIHWITGYILALGVAVALTRAVRPRLAEFPRYCVRWVPRLALLLLLLVGLRATLTAVHRRFVLASLPEARSRTNVLLIVHDTERAASLSLYGHSRPTTPFLESLAARGITFDLAVAPSSWTLPSHGSLFTGRQSLELDLWSWVALDAGHTTLAELLRDGGYHTAGFAGNLVFLNPAFGLNQGFIDWKGSTAGVQSLLASSWPVRRLTAFLREGLHPVGYAITKDARAVTGEFIGWLDRRNADRPWFAFLNYFDVHEPYLPSVEAQSRLLGRIVTEKPLLVNAGKSADNYAPELRRTMLDAYEAEILQLDDEMRDLFDALRERGQLDSTIVIVTSDHGEQFGEHGIMNHENSLYRPLIHVPLVIVTPGNEHAGTRVAGPVQVLDVGATILDLLGIPADRLRGASLAPLWVTGTSDRPAFSSMDGMVSVILDGYNIIERQDGRLEVYRLTDTAELTDLSGAAEVRDVVERARRIFRDAGWSGGGG
jgi:arylsulfatase A-like enzyme